MNCRRNCPNKMVFHNIKYGAWKEEIKALVRKRLVLREKIRYHKMKIVELENDKLSVVEADLNKYLKMAGN